jgi:hypothetical protein
MPQANSVGIIREISSLSLPYNGSKTGYIPTQTPIAFQHDYVSDLVLLQL